MAWLEISLSIDRAAVGAVEDVLAVLGALAVTLEDSADDPLLEPGPGCTPLWPVVTVRGLFEHTTDRRTILDALSGVPGAGRPETVHWREVEDQDWERAWMERFRPMRFGRRLWVVPSGMASPGTPGAVEVRLDPGLAFGTGTHPTTALCLEWLDGQPVAGRRVVDYGCGSGILGIAAALLGAVRVVCVDNDPQALESTAVNAARNAVGDRVDCMLPDAFAESGVDIVVANILAGPLVDLAPELVRCARRGGRIVLSGLLEEQRVEVTEAYQPACRVTGTAVLDGWARVELLKS